MQPIDLGFNPLDTLGKIKFPPCYRTGGWAGGRLKAQRPTHSFCERYANSAAKNLSGFRIDTNCHHFTW
ncbi:hypothetical protein DFLDMN_004712 [Cupriavidus sp. H19C3]